MTTRVKFFCRLGDQEDVSVIADIDHGSPQTFWEPATPPTASIFQAFTEDGVEFEPSDEELETLEEEALAWWASDYYNEDY